MDELLKNLPEIIKAASQSKLGIVALSCVALAVLAYLFFRSARIAVRIGIFVLLFAGVVAFGVAMFRTTQAPSRVVQPYQSEFGPAHRANESFDGVKSLFAQDIARVRAISTGEDRRAQVSALLDHYFQTRRTYYVDFRQEFEKGQSVTKGSSGGRKQSPVRVACAPNMTIVEGSVSMTGVGGCYSDTTTSTWATGTVSQTGKGRSECSLKITCRLTPEFIEQNLASEHAALQNLSVD
jgi:hypothetical protein